ncbi:hypothetical protein AVEN_162038-1 [Araneus ventricosus]|uniref:Uncharacterized protein n=1 Tax=Araneus ventricosus TaxID=182803 RepID=A0A4Y2THR6_ARAVE|nr:hypothetical protein AVEN_162038-1 [Araneus ventricosus]
MLRQVGISSWYRFIIRIVDLYRILYSICQRVDRLSICKFASMQADGKVDLLHRLEKKGFGFPEVLSTAGILESRFGESDIHHMRDGHW